MKGFSEKIHLIIEPPTEEHPVGDRERILHALEERGFSPANMSLSALRGLYPLCRDSEWDITATLIHMENGCLVTSVEAGDTTKAHYGLAVDLGSTTVVMQMIHLDTGKILSETRVMNGQIAFGDDILTRIIYGKDDRQKLLEITQATRNTFSELFRETENLTGIPISQCSMMIVSGNTTMIHFLLGLDPWTVFSSPYAPVACDPGFFSGDELGLTFSGMIYIVPAIANYLGGDITSGLLTTDFYKKDGLSVFFDIGTNGELVLGNSSFLLAGAGAAGPALEGDISKYGMRATAGAIDTVSIDGVSISCTTIENKKPVGICGSGIIDLIAQMRLNGWIDVSGKLNPEASDRVVYIPELEEYAAVYASPEESGNGKMLYFSQTDIMQYLDTKAAAHTMVDCLLEESGFTPEDLTAFYTSGAFGTYTDLESAITVGIFPDLPREKFHCLQNSSLAGARELLLNRDRMRDIRYFQQTIYCIQFASIPDFLIKMQASKFIPHTDMRQYPTVAEKLAARPETAAPVKQN
ncbi:MAG: ASKHA domain-containing protein [Lachnospiraceae bacterium]|nr:ASKHA domain-containing protein [Lachnospiraceae bacterium]